MLDRYDRRDTRERDGSWDRSRCSRGVACERDRNEGQDPHDVLMKDLDLPRGRQREVVRERERVYEINRAESRMLATVGAFRAVARLEGGKRSIRRPKPRTPCPPKRPRAIREGGSFKNLSRSHRTELRHRRRLTKESVTSH